ncbi:hypothetical protein PYJP_13820 [Pyrofollis japonicus]|nr:hypothetical protein PYJP_13820 [Pyrofollis japonicus]
MRGVGIVGVLCRRLGYMCGVDPEAAPVLAAYELAVLETYLLLYNAGGEELVTECLGDENCLRELIDTVNTAAELHIRGNRYFYTLTLRDIETMLRIAEKLALVSKSHR